MLTSRWPPRWWGERGGQWTHRGPGTALSATCTTGPATANGKIADGPRPRPPAAKMVLLKAQRVLDDRPDAPERQREAFRLVRLEGHALVASEKQRLLGQ